ncbi:MAG TPA: Mur ligase family protein [candidate division Zixibacteria bacterium]|nr:Mur ligase family protein [candidate division Zixibacteria bacterium]
MAQQAQPEAAAELLELRVLDGPNRFANRPAIKLEFAAPEPGRAEAVAAAAGDAVQRLHAELELPVPRLAFRVSVDRRRASVAFPWRRRTRAQAIAAAAARIALGAGTFRRELRSVRAVAPGPLPVLPVPPIPVVAVTGTNGKSTTTRLIAHVLSLAGRSVGMTNSDGIHVRGRLVEPGDWTGFGGAARVLSEPGLDVAVLETARGGILLRGIGYAANDVGVVTNVSADHLGLQGIDTLDELADVKATVVRITRRSGWAVLNAEDERVWAMRRQTRAGWYAFSLDPDTRGVREALEHGGRAAVLRDGWLVLLGAGRRARRLAPVDELPVTFAGLSEHNVANALAAAAACDALGVRPARIAAGLRSFAMDSAANPGRLNLFARDGRLVLVDFAHNEAGLAGLLRVCRALADGTGGRVLLALGTAGDRTDEILTRLGHLAGRGADVLVICEKPHYLRGRDLEVMNELFRRGAAEGGYRRRVPSHPSELAALQALVRRSRPGDVAAVMSHAERDEIFAWLAARGFAPMPQEKLRAILRGTRTS